MPEVYNTTPPYIFLMTAEELLESEVLIYLQGLGFPQKA